MTSAYIKIMKKAIANDRGLIAALVAYDPKKAVDENAVMCEFAYAAGFDAMHEETEDMTPEEIEDQAVQLNIDISVDGAEADVDVDDDSED